MTGIKKHVLLFEMWHYKMKFLIRQRHTTVFIDAFAITGVSSMQNFFSNLQNINFCLYTLT